MNVEYDDGNEQIVATITAPPARNEPQKPKKDGWAGIYIDYRREDVRHRFLTDCYTGMGGFLGFSKDGGGSGESYLIPFTSEMQYLTRLAHSEYVAYFARNINAKVAPVFMDEIPIAAGDEGKTAIPPMLQDFYDSAVTGQPYNAVKRRAVTDALIHDVAYVVMDKRDDGTVICYTKPIGCVYGEPETDGLDFVGIRFALDDEEEEGETTGTRRKYERCEYWYMDNGYCWYAIQRRETGKRGAEWVTVEERNTGVDAMCVYPLQPDTVEIGDYMPCEPQAYAVARLCADVYNISSVVKYSHLLAGVAIPYVYGKFDQVSVFSGGLELGPDANGNYPPSPGYLQPSADNLRELVEYREQCIADMREVMREYGVISAERPTSQAQSGESKSYDFWATEQALKQTVGLCRKLDDWVFAMWSKLTSLMTGIQIYCVYPDSFTPEQPPAIADLLAVAGELSTIASPDAVAVRNALLIKAAAMLLGDSMPEAKEVVNGVAKSD